LYPYGIKPEQYVDALGILRVIDKLFRIATKKDAFDESPWRDIAGYGILGAVRDEIKSQTMSAEDESKQASEKIAVLEQALHRTMREKDSNPPF
jgi:hypothetical protein